MWARSINVKNIKWKYKLSGASVQSIVVSFIALAIFGGVSVWLHLSDNGAYLFTDIMTAFMLVIAIHTIYVHIFVRLMISDEGFYFQTSPLNGRYYSYSEVEKAWLSSGTTIGGIPSGFYFNFKTVEGKEFKFPYQNYQADEIEYLENMINKAGRGRTLS